MRTFLARMLLTALCYLIMTPLSSGAHFALVLPSDDIVASDDAKVLEIEVSFLHPFEQAYMDMAKPRSFGVIYGDARHNLRATLDENRKQGVRTWHTSYRVLRPGAHIFYMEPEPYWEKAERKFIIHYTKVVVGSLGLDEGWNASVGLPLEIEPLARSFGVWSGNVFSGIVKKDGKPVPFANVEVEYLNFGGAVTAPNDSFITQVIKTDVNGVFVYAMPREGWWGFAALLEADSTIKHEGKAYPVELGGVIWVRVRDMKE